MRFLNRLKTLVKHRRALAWLQQQFQIRPGKPVYIYGARILLILAGPIAAGLLLGQPKISTIPTLSALFIGMITVSGTYRQQATATGVATMGVTLAFLLANLVSGSFWLSVVTMAAVIFLAGLATLWGAAATGVSLVTSLMFVVSLAKFSSFPNMETVLIQCALCLAGGLWTIAVSSGLWIVRPYTPAMEIVANCYATLAQLAELIKERLSISRSQVSQKPILSKNREIYRQDWTKAFLQTQDAAIQNLSAARDIWASVWTTEKVQSPRGNQLLVAIEDANRINHALGALIELVAIASVSPLLKYLKPEIEQALEQIAASLQALSLTLKKRQSKRQTSTALTALTHSIEALEARWHSLRQQIYDHTIPLQPREYADIVNLRKVIISISELATQIQTDTKTVTDSAPSTANLNATIPKRFLSAQSKSPSWFTDIRNNLTFRSVVFRHALRLAIVVAIAQILSDLLPIPRGYWVTLTVLIALKPNFGGTFEIIGQRILGTFVGSVLGIVLVMLVHNTWAIALLILLLMFAAMSLRPLSYTLFITLLTPVIVLLFEAMGVGSWEVGLQRTVDTLIGGAITILGSYLLFPSWERQQLPAQLEHTICANLAYFQVAITKYLQRENSITKNKRPEKEQPKKEQPEKEQSQESRAESWQAEDEIFERLLHRLRHQAALENANAEAAAQRLFSEPRHIRGKIEPVMTLVLYTRRLFSAITALAEHFKTLQAEDRFTSLEPLTDAIEQVLLNFSDAIKYGQMLQPLPPLAEYLDVICDHVQQLHSDRLSEIAAAAVTTTPTWQAAQTHTPIATEFGRIVQAVTIMHSAISRMQASEQN